MVCRCWTAFRDDHEQVIVVGAVGQFGSIDRQPPDSIRGVEKSVLRVMSVRDPRSRRSGGHHFSARDLGRGDETIGEMALDVLGREPVRLSAAAPVLEDRH
jgi:hypothetical protein